MTDLLWFCSTALIVVAGVAGVLLLAAVFVVAPLVSVAVGFAVLEDRRLQKARLAEARLRYPVTPRWLVELDPKVKR